MWEAIGLVVAFGTGWVARSKFGTLGDVWAWVKSWFTTTTPAK